MTPFVQHATTAALAIVAGFGGEGVVGPYGDRTATRTELVEVFTEAERFALVASGWAGYRIPPEVVFAVGTQESCWRNLCRHCRGGGALNGRSAGYFSETVGCVVSSADALGIVRSIELWPGADRWVPVASAEQVCDWTVAHPRYQVRILLQRMALHTRRMKGDLWGALAVYGPEDSSRDYPADIRNVWRRGFPGTWPKNGRLDRL